MNALRPLNLAIGSMLAIVAGAQQKSPFTYRDMLMPDRISGLAVDPAGTSALFSVRATDLEQNRGAVAVRSGFVLYDLGR
jgi:acylaminoacyl-peptidase